MPESRRDAQHGVTDHGTAERDDRPQLDGRVSLTVADAPLLELDGRAHDILDAPERLRGLLLAIQMIIGDAALPVVLQRTVEAARELVGARYAALGVIAPNGHLAEFVHAGMPAEAVERIGHLPQGRGLLGALIEDPRPIRRARIADDPRSSGFPAGHPPMASFLGVPIRVRDEVFGNLYLAESVRAEFTADDEQMVQALAASAAVTIENARLHEAAEKRQEWLRASASITRELILSDAQALVTGAPSAAPRQVQDLLRVIARLGGEVAGADVVTVVRPAGAGLRVEVAVGAGTDHLVGLDVPMEGSLSGQVFSTGRPLQVPTPPERPDVDPADSTQIDVGPTLAMPLLGSQRMHGVLTMARVAGRVAFSAEDLEMASGFATHAAVALELAEARLQEQRTEMLDERERIAADLHDQVIQRLFVIGLSLQGLLGSVRPGRVAHRIEDAVQSLDDTISQIRRTIFGLTAYGPVGSAGTRAQLLDVIAELTPALGVHPTVRFTGLLDTVPTQLTQDLLAVLREALSNTARHAHARSVEIDVAARRDRVELAVHDDGIGISPGHARSSGLANLRRRAARHGGTLTVVPRRPRGTSLCWSVPRPDG